MTYAKSARLPDHRGAKLLADGRHALRLRAQGVAPTDILTRLGCSRPRMYKAMQRARAVDGDQSMVQCNEEKDLLLL